MIQSGVKGYALLILLSVIWGIAFVAIRRADFELSPINLTLLRWFIAVAGFLALSPVIGKSKSKFERKDLPRMVAIGLTNVVVYHLSLNYAEVTVSSGLAGLLISTGPVFVVVLSVLSLRESVGARLISALVFAILGALVLSAPDLVSSSSPLLGPLEVVLAAFSYSVFSVLSKPLVNKYGAGPVTIWAALLGTAMLLPLVSMNFVSQVTALSFTGWLSVLYLSILSTVLGYFLFFTLVSRGAVSRLSVQLYLVPIVSVIGGILLLSEGITISTVIGGAALLISVGLATGIRK